MEELRAHLHREEHLEAEIRLLRQSLRNLAEAIIVGQEDAVVIAKIAVLMLDDEDR